MGFPWRRRAGQGRAVGLYQVNVEIPAGVAAGPEVPLVLIQNGVPSNAVTLALR